MLTLPKKFTGNEQHSVAAAEAIDYINEYRLHAGPEAVPGGFIDKGAIQALVQQPEAVGFRYYHGCKDNGLPVLVFVGTNSRRDDLIDGEPVKVSILRPPLNDRGMYDFTKANHAISLVEAARLTANYRRSKAPRQPIGGFFGKAAVQNLLDQPGTVGIRFYFGLNKDGIDVMVMLGINQFGSEMFYGLILELSALCPPLCGNSNLLNSGLHIQEELKVLLEYAEADTHSRMAA